MPLSEVQLPFFSNMQSVIDFKSSANANKASVVEF